MPFIQNVSLDAIKKGHHIDPGINSVLIQIVDTDMHHPEPKYEFKEIHRFQFMDVEQPECLDGPKQEDADKIVSILQHALENRMTVLVHCVAGICRSGAVAEVGVMMGFQDSGSFRIPNILLKKMMMRKLAWTYD